MSREIRRNSIVVRFDASNMEILAAHQGGIVHGGRVIIERADVHDLLECVKEWLRAARSKDWNACPYESHADDCDCGGRGGDR
jgi:hypothetical protein